MGNTRKLNIILPRNMLAGVLPVINASFVLLNLFLSDSTAQNCEVAVGEKYSLLVNADRHPLKLICFEP